MKMEDIVVTEIDGAVYIWHSVSGGAKILRVYADRPQLIIPSDIEGDCIVSIGAYCFSNINKINDMASGVLQKCMEELLKLQSDKSLREFCGDYVERVILPDSIESIGNNAFYNCRNMNMLSIGSNVIESGSDIFMNCKSFERLEIRGSVHKPSGLKSVLSRYASNLQVVFDDAVFFYPEYTDSYDEIAPAHIFGRNIIGEGFRARQCFEGDILNIAQYDAVFDKASVEENVWVLNKMAFGRLMYPEGLSDENKEKYINYIRNNQNEIAKLLAANKELDILHFMFSNGYADVYAIDIAIDTAVEKQWSEGAASLLKWKYDFYQNIKKRRYEL